MAASDVEATPPIAAAAATAEQATKCPSRRFLSVCIMSWSLSLPVTEHDPSFGAGRRHEAEANSQGGSPHHANESRDRGIYPNVPLPQEGLDPRMQKIFA